MDTTKVEMLESVSGEGDEFNGIEGPFSLPFGAEVELPSDLAQKWAVSGRCKIIAPAPAPTPTPKGKK